MESRTLIPFLLLPVFAVCSSVLFPVERSVLGTSCTWKGKNSGTARMLDRCSNFDKSENEFVGVIIGLGTVVCCPEAVRPPNIKVKKLTAVGDKAKAFCTSESSTTLSPLTEKVIGGNFSDVGEFPHLAALGYENFDGDVEFRCGGALISHRFVLTAAHCLIRDTPKLVRLGRTDLNLEKKAINYDSNPAVDVPVKTSKSHPSYTTKNKYNDIGLVELDERVKFTEYIKPVCLQVDADLSSERRKIILAGWGFIDKDKTQRSDWLMKAVTDEIPLDACRTKYESLGQLNLRKMMPQNVMESQLCAQKEGIDTCQGDSGAPIQIVSNDTIERYYAVGVVSFGLGCASNIPAVYARVSQYIEWIESEVWPENNLT